MHSVSDIKDCDNPQKITQKASRKVSQKYRKAYLRKLRRKEYSKLRAILPNISKKEKVSKVTVVEEAIKYIDQLHQTLYQRLQEKGLASSQVSPENMIRAIQQLAPFHMTAQTNSAQHHSLPDQQQQQSTMSAAMYQKDQKRPSYLLHHPHRRV